MSSTTRPILWVDPTRSWRAEPLRTSPNSSMAFWTRERVSSETNSGWFSTLETVPSKTPAWRATSCILCMDDGLDHQELDRRKHFNFQLFYLRHRINARTA